MKNTTAMMVAVIVVLFMVLFYGMKTRQDHQNNNWQHDTWSQHDFERPDVLDVETDDNDDADDEDEDKVKKQITAKNYRDALKKSKEHKMPILIMFHADWCHWCTKMEHSTLSDRSVKELMKNYVFLSLDTDKDRRTTRKFGVRGLPSYVVTDHTEKTLKKGSGYKGANDFSKWLKSNNDDNQPRFRRG